ncbi:cytochrome c peroxidase [Pseudochryseolinea flava]|nr:cytochrome c peroxidase [Pseudochryseolinea flava]
MKYFLFLVIASCTLMSCNHVSQQNATPADKIEAYYREQIDSMAMCVDSLYDAVENKAPVDKIRKHFIGARLHWKHIEPLTEYYFANVSEAVNGPALPEEEDYDSKIQEPTGFQVIEELIYPQYDTLQHQELLQEIGILKSTMPRVKQLYESNQFTDANIFEACRLELLRIVSLGISGFDSPVAQLSVSETRHSLFGIKNILQQYPRYEEARQLDSLFSALDNFLQQRWTFNSFDRARFIQRYVVPLSEQIYRHQQRLGVINNKWLTAVDMNYPNVIDAAALRRSFFSSTATQSLAPSKDLIELGRVLFFDPVLSGNNARACASCHQPDKAFTDGNKKSLAFGGRDAVFRNAPTLINATFQKAQFSDSRVAFLEEQVMDVVHNAVEMNGDITSTSKRLESSEEYRTMFKKAFPAADSTEIISAKHIRVAIASYVRSLSSFNSKFDHFIRGENTLNVDEVAGLNLFMGKAKCGTCHFMPLFNGSVPPMFVETESEVLGVPGNADSLRPVRDGDAGKILVSSKSLQRDMFKTSTVRNAALTAPYMHNGVYQTLEEVIDFYNRGGGAGLGIILDNQTLPTDALQLTSLEKKQIILFIGTLTDTTGLTRVPSRLPFLKGDHTKRRIGGEY